MTKTNTKQQTVSIFDFTQELTADVIAQRVAYALEALDSIFRKDETRFLADNGKFYSKDWSLPDGVSIIDANGEPVDIMEAPGVLHNVNAFDSKQLVNCVTNKLERMLDSTDQRLTSNRSRLRYLLQQVQKPDSGVTERQVETVANIVERGIEQQACQLVALRSAMEAHNDLTGEAYETAAARSERERLGTSPKADDPNAKYRKLLG